MNFDDFGGFVGDLSKFDVSGEEDVADFVADAVGSVEGADGGPFGAVTTYFFA